jgi:hypothetical protein
MLPAASRCGPTLLEDTSKAIFHASLVFWYADVWSRPTLHRDVDLLHSLVTQVHDKVFNQKQGIFLHLWVKKYE